jgi:hypothetical protein
VITHKLPVAVVVSWYYHDGTYILLSESAIVCLCALLPDCAYVYACSYIVCVCVLCVCVCMRVRLCVNRVRDD